MKFVFVRNMLAIIGISFLVGCAGKPNVHLSETFWQNPKQKIVIASLKAPEPMVHRVGPQGLVDHAINGTLNSGMNKHLKQTDLGWYNDTAVDFEKQLKSRNFEAKVHGSQFDSGKKNYDNLLAQVNGDKLLTLELKAIGGRRGYYGFIPTESPKAYCVLVGKLVDLKDKKVCWHSEEEVIIPVKGSWDQAPHYPNFTNALQVAINTARNRLLENFFSGH